MPNSASALAASFMMSRSESLPMTMETRGLFFFGFSFMRYNLCQLLAEVTLVPNCRVRDHFFVGYIKARFPKNTQADIVNRFADQDDFGIGLDQVAHSAFEIFERLSYFSLLVGAFGYGQTADVNQEKPILLETAQVLCLAGAL